MVTVEQPRVKSFNIAGIQFLYISNFRDVCTDNSLARFPYNTFKILASCGTYQEMTLKFGQFASVSALSV